jgi:hypothetical protein
MSHPDAEFLKDYLAPLKGAMIVDVSVSEEEEGAWPVLTVQTKTDRLTLEVSRDEEGNGPGFIHGLPFPEGEAT